MLLWLNHCLLHYWVSQPNVLALSCSGTDTEVHPRAGRGPLQRRVGWPAHREGLVKAPLWSLEREPPWHRAIARRKAPTRGTVGREI